MELQFLHQNLQFLYISRQTFLQTQVTNMYEVQEHLSSSSVDPSWLNSESFAAQPAFELLVKVTFDPQGHGDLVDLRGHILPRELLQELLHVLLQSPDVPLHLPHQRHLTVAVGQVGVHRDVVHAGAANHVGQRWRSLRRGGPAGGSGTGVLGRIRDP